MAVDEDDGGGEGGGVGGGDVVEGDEVIEEGDGVTQGESGSSRSTIFYDVKPHSEGKQTEKKFRFEIDIMEGNL